MNRSCLTPKASILSVLGIATVLLVGAPKAQSMTLGEYTFGSGAGDVIPRNVSPGASFSDFSYVGSGTTNQPSGNGAGKAFSANDWSEDSDISGDAYFTFTVTPDANTKLTLEELSFDGQRNGNASPTNLFVRSSLDNFVGNLLDTSLGSKNDWNPFNITLDSSFANLMQAVEFRFYAYGQENNNGADNWEVDNVALSGSAAPATAVPTPALLPGLIGFGMGIIRKRKQQAVA